jgi:mannosyl-oligosaccharide alpha-1,2-mannosidase
MPYNLVNFTTNEPVVDITNIAQVGTLSMEWGTLSKHTGNDTYRQLAEKAVKAVIAVPDPLLGLPAQDIDPTTGKSVDGYVVC